MNFILRKLICYPISCAIAVIIWIICLIPVPETPLDDVSFIDKWTHFLIYGTLTSIIWLEYSKNRKWQKPTLNKRLLIGGVIYPITMGCLVELAQAYLTTCRSGDVFDALCNAIGVLTPILFWYLAAPIRIWINKKM